MEVQGFLFFSSYFAQTSEEANAEFQEDSLELEGCGDINLFRSCHWLTAVINNQTLEKVAR